MTQCPHIVRCDSGRPFHSKHPVSLAGSSRGPNFSGWISRRVANLRPPPPLSPFQADCARSLPRPETTHQDERLFLGPSVRFLGYNVLLAHKQNPAGPRPWRSPFPRVPASSSSSCRAK